MSDFRYDLRRSFFDRKSILDRIGKKRAGILSKMGAYVRRDAKGLIRKGKKPSKPGSPPKSHTGLLKDLISFEYDTSSESCFVGPEKTNQVFFSGDGRPVSGTVPETLELGGSIQILEVWKPFLKKWVRADLRSKRRLAGQQTRLRAVRIAARPFMGPALEKNLDKFPGLWAGVVS